MKMNYFNRMQLEGRQLLNSLPVPIAIQISAATQSKRLCGFTPHTIFFKRIFISIRIDRWKNDPIKILGDFFNIFII